METLITMTNTKAGRIAATLAKDIETGRFSPGAFLPAERELAKSYRVSTMTMRKSLGILSENGRLVKLPQRGVVVADPTQKEPKIGQIAFIAPMLTGDANPYIKGLIETIDHDRFSLATYTPHGDFLKFQKIIENVARQKPVGVVIWVPFEELCEVHDDMFREVKIPIVTLGQHLLPRVPTDNVRDSTADGAEKVAQFILNKGIRDIAFLCTCSRKLSEEQIETIRRILSPAGISLPDERVFVVQTPRGFADPPNPYLDTQEYVEKLLAGGFKCECLICGHDYPAVGALRAIQSAGIRVPREIKIISLCKNAVEGATPMKLTTIDLRCEAQARKAVQLLMRRIDGYQGHPEIHYTSVDLIEGETT